MVEPLNTKAWVMVPVEPTQAMVTAATQIDFDNEDEAGMAINLWQAMVSTSPALPAVDGGEIVERLLEPCRDYTGEMIVRHSTPRYEVHCEVLYDAATLISTQQQEIERLRGLQPEFPPYPPEGDGLPRFGLRWNGPSQPLTVPMEDGYWTPYHLASLYRSHVNAAERELSEVSRAIGSVRWMDPPDGGDVSLGEQVSRMRADLEAAESRVQSLEEEVKRLRESLTKISSPSQSDGLLWWQIETRAALKENGQ
ncbi:hypothetical protein VW35_01055 [Devosia soli]|uniref:Uncharacterized protein n=1 Tax=Devosia soli TaxID=361041 RepID=A0A0F5LEP2_9HYPH|nr:hypothetical protein [Devosia soli]KKB80828.1 hypothetical protein VW35_01055 [Devosia soli]